MAYTLQQIFEALGKVENGGSMVADLQTEISKVRSEAANNRISRNKVLDALGLRDVRPSAVRRRPSENGDADGNVFPAHAGVIPNQ